MSKPSLDELILQAERTLVTRQARLSRHSRQAGERLKRAAPWVLGGGLAAIMGTALISRWIRPPLVQTPAAAAAQRHAGGQAPGAQNAPPWWTRWLVLVWPLVPAGVRQRLGPGEGLPLVALGLKVRQLLLALARRRVVTADKAGLAQARGATAGAPAASPTAAPVPAAAPAAELTP